MTAYCFFLTDVLQCEDVAEAHFHCCGGFHCFSLGFFLLRWFQALTGTAAVTNVTINRLVPDQPRAAVRDRNDDDDEDESLFSFYSYRTERKSVVWCFSFHLSLLCYFFGPSNGYRRKAAFENVHVQ